jgi:hypothetical protein
MKTTMKLLGFIAIVAITGFSMAACAGLDFTGGGNSSTSASASSATSASSASASAAVENTSLNGSWTGKIGKNTYLLSYNDGNYTGSVNGYSSERGTYTVVSKSLTMTGTHAHGDWLIANGLALEKRWYTQAELEAALKGKMSAANIATTCKNLFSPQKVNYAVKGDRLTWSGPGGSLRFNRTN